MKVFVAGTRAVRTLNKTVTDALSGTITKQRTILLGDAAGVDRLIQEYFAKAEYPNVYVYASDGKVRHNVGDWPVCKVEVPAKAEGFDFYVQKDIVMAQDADSGFMIWNGKSKGTLNNIINLVTQNKKVFVYLTSIKKMYCIDDLDRVRDMAERFGPETFLIYEALAPRSYSIARESGCEQLSLSGLNR